MKRNLLFLIRAYNDMDHFAPVMWKAAKEDFGVYFFFVGKWRAEDYRREICCSAGALEVNSKLLTWYHNKFKPLLGSSKFNRIFDAVICVVAAFSLLIRFRIGWLLVEWCGPSGRVMGRYVLIAGRFLRIPTISLPHGYHIWRNKLITWDMVKYGAEDKRYNFFERNRFYRYVVQSENIMQYFLDRKIYPDKLKNMGSARFCEEWATKNLEGALAEYGIRKYKLAQPFVVLFLGNWNYRVNRSACIDLILALSDVFGKKIIVKGHSRGDIIGGLTDEERSLYFNSEAIVYADDHIHSNTLIYYSNGIINFGSSIALEAVVQEKPICDVSFLTENETIFTGSGVVFSADNNEQVLDFVQCVLSGNNGLRVPESVRQEFLVTNVYGGIKGRDVLADYVNLCK